MTIVMTLPSSDAADSLQPQLLFHLHAGVDAVVVIGEPTDGVGGLESDSRVHVVADPSAAVRTVADLGADWIVPAEAGEFWWPRGGSLDGILTRISDDYDVVQALARPFVPTRNVEAGFIEQMTYRLSAQALLDDPEGAWRPRRRLLHRGGVDVDGYDPSKVVHGSTSRPLRGWYPIEVLWFPVRSGLRADGSGDPAELERGVALGVLQVDTRLRDAMRAIRSGSEIAFTRPTIVDNALYAADAAVLGEGDVYALRGELDELERRLGALETKLVVRLERKLRTLARRGHSSP